MSKRSAMRFSAICVLQVVNRCEQLGGVLLALALYLLQVCGFEVGEIASSLVGESLDPRPHVLFRQFKDLAWTAVAIGGLAEGQRLFFGVTSVPKVIQAVEE